MAVATFASSAISSATLSDSFAASISSGTRREEDIGTCSVVQYSNGSILYTERAPNGNWTTHYVQPSPFFTIGKTLSAVASRVYSFFANIPSLFPVADAKEIRFPSQETLESCLNQNRLTSWQTAPYLNENCITGLIAKPFADLAVDPRSIPLGIDLALHRQNIPEVQCHDDSTLPVKERMATALEECAKAFDLPPIPHNPRIYTSTTSPEM